MSVDVNRSGGHDQSDVDDYFAGTRAGEIADIMTSSISYP